MGDPKGFIKIQRKEAGNRPIPERIYDFSEVEQTLNTEDRKLQASRCMDCGIPFCHWGCPVENIIPEWNDAVYKGEWKRAIDLMHATNNFPEFTGRICPAPCEHACVLNIENNPVTIRENEAAIAEYAFSEGYIKPQPPKIRSGKKVAVIGSGPAGLAAADQLNKAGHLVTVFERADAIGGLLRYGIPDFKLSKVVIDRRLDILQQEGIIFKTGIEVGKDLSAGELLDSYDAICLTVGATKPRDLPVEGRQLSGVHFAMEFLTQQNKINKGETVSPEDRISAKDKHVLVIGGGDTGSDCVGTSIRQGAKKVTQIEILPKPPEKREDNNPWPYYGYTLKTSTSHQEGCERRWNLSTLRFHGDTKVEKAEVSSVEWLKNGLSRPEMRPVPDSSEFIQADLVLLAMGFVQPEHEGLLNDLKLAYTDRNNVKISGDYQTTVPKVFAAGDTVLGASLVVRAIFSGRSAAREINNFLSSQS
ncbi:MAG: glutamate synthase subunit beta [Bacteroidales bacterium]|nr:glutamate synthase subunit beta [Bacteroidales bacterium]MCB9013905.1 glutamate synthase subunit beta [Bacteroidales bacterium]